MLRVHAPHDGPQIPLLLHLVGRLWCWAYGWKVEGEVSGAKAILIAHPHTSNWDLPHMIAVAACLGTFCSWLGKESLFKPPFGFVLKWLGGIPVDRSAPKGQVGEAIDRIGRTPRILLVVPPSGTRSRRDGWKSGFYWIASGAQVPIVCGYLDYGRKRAGIANPIMPSGDVKADMDKIRSFYGDMTGLYPENNTRIYLKAEHDQSSGAESSVVGSMSHSAQVSEAGRSSQSESSSSSSGSVESSESAEGSTKASSD